MDADQVARTLEEIGTLLELQGENAFKCQAYHNAARTLHQLEAPLDQMIADGTLGEVRGIGARLKEQITALARDEELEVLVELRNKTPPGLIQMLRLPGVGPKKVKAIHDQLGVENLESLRSACEAGQVAALKGFGAKTEKKILEGLDFLGRTADRVRLDQALPLAERLLAAVRVAPGVGRAEVCGSVRRRRETIKDIDLLVTADDAGPVMDLFTSQPGVVSVIGRGDTKASIVVADSRGVTMNADLRVVTEEQFPFALHYFTGSKDHNIALRQRALERGGKLNEYELTGPTGPVACRDEAALFEALGYAWVPPELREMTGELEAAEKGTLPRLIEVGDLKGVFHNHTTWSDGTNSVAEMAEAARGRGWSYLGLADHSQSLTVANGLSPERVKRQWEEIDRVNAGLKGFQIFKGTESDILPDGSLDYDDGLLAGFDYVVVSVHSHFAQPREEMTARIIRAIRHPATTMLGHATGRLLLRRDCYAVDLEAVLQAAAERGVMVEINANPQRLDLDWVHVKRAKALGVMLVINPDAHGIADLGYDRYGIDVARRGWLEAADVFNTGTLAQVKKELTRRRMR